MVSPLSVSAIGGGVELGNSLAQITVIKAVAERPPPLAPEHHDDARPAVAVGAELVYLVEVQGNLVCKALCLRIAAWLRGTDA